MLLRSRVIFWSWSCIFRAVDKVSTSSWHSLSPFRVFPFSDSFPLSVKLQFSAVAMLRSCSCKVWADVSRCENCLMKASRASASKKKHQCCISSEFPTKQLTVTGRSNKAETRHKFACASNNKISLCWYGPHLSLINYDKLWLSKP